MADFARMKRVTDPLDDEAKARIVGRRCEDSSGSEHSAEVDDDVLSPSLSVLVYDFLHDDTDGDRSPERDSDSERDQSDTVDDFVKLKSIVHVDVDSFRNLLYVRVLKTLELFSCVKSNKPFLRRNVMAFLRNLGYNAAICKTKWESTGGLSSGNYEFIDVVQTDSANRVTRYFVDLDFAGEFVIARSTNQYHRLLESVPRVFVGKNEALKQIVKVMSDAAKRSLKSRGLSTPPWRKNRYMQNKWFGQYLRTVNTYAANTPQSISPAKQTHAVKCRSVGFNAVNGGACFPTRARTK